jgi:ribosomal protein L13
VRWSEAAAAAHAAEGRVLAGRLARELAATGRGHVKVVYHPVGGDLETVAPGAS